MLYHGYPEVVALPAPRREPEVDDREPGEREEHQHRDGVGEVVEVVVEGREEILPGDRAVHPVGGEGRSGKDIGRKNGRAD